MSNINRAAATVDREAGVAFTARNATLGDLAAVLKEQHGRKIDVVAPATAIRSDAGTWVVENAEPVIDADGVGVADGHYVPTGHADNNLAQRLEIPRAYLRRLREQRVDLYDANVNGWLHGVDAETRYLDGSVTEGSYLGDARSFMVRAFRGDDGVGIARAFLSDRYRIVDNLDVLTAALGGLREAGVDVEIESADLSETRMYVRVAAPSVYELAPDLLAGYRSPFTGATGVDNPVISAGFVISNSEVGHGAMTIVPRLRVEVCKNGMTIAKDALRAVHLGSRLDEGVIRWSDETQQANLDLVRRQAADAVTTFLDVDYMKAKIAEMRTLAGKPVDKPADAVKHVAKTLAYGEAAADDILNHFIAGGQQTAMGLANAITSFAQTITDPDRAASMEADAMQVLSLV